MGKDDENGKKGKRPGFPFEYGKDEKENEFMDNLGPSDVLTVKIVPETLKGYCKLGDRVCDVCKKVGGICKGGKKFDECPKIIAARKKEEKGEPVRVIDPDWIGPDNPFNYKEVVEECGEMYANHVNRDGLCILSPEEKKKQMIEMEKRFPKK